MPYDIAPEARAFTSFGGLLRFLRVRAGLTQRDLAVAVGYSEAHISRLETDQRRPDRNFVYAHFLPALDPGAGWAERLLELAAPEPDAPPPAAPPAIAPPADRQAANAGVLNTKLYQPLPRPGALRRPHLLKLLDRAMEVPLTLVAAPAGFGKTTLLAGWIAEWTQDATDRSEQAPASHVAAPAAPAWLSLDANDNDLPRFVRHLVAAFRRLRPAAGAQTLALLDAPQLLPPEALITPLLNDLATLDQPSMCILDDYQSITDPRVHALIAFLVERIPPCLHLVIATRADPPWPLARLRARNHLLEIRTAHLRFGDDETLRFFRETMDVPINAGEAQTIAARTEGWVTGLQLAALALEEQPDRAQFITAFNGSNRYVLDYLAEEILAHLPAHLRRFLLQTSILERFCAATCDVVLGLGADPTEGYSRLILAELQQRNLFLVPLDTERRWYRYHHLFADVLREHLRQGAAHEQIAELYRRAAAWFEEQGFIVEAMNYAQAGDNTTQIVGLIERHADPLRKRGKYRLLDSWLAPLPAATISARPRLALARAYHLFITQNPEGARRALADVEQALAASDLDPADRLLLGSEAAVLAAGLSLNRGDYRGAYEQAHRALAELPPDQLRLRGETLLYLGLANAHLSHTAVAMACFGEAQRLSLEAGDLHNTIFALCTAAGLERLHGRLPTAVERYLQGLTLAATHQVELMPIMGLLHGDYAEVLYERNELAAAETQARAAVVNAERNGSLRFLAMGKYNLARVLWANGEPAQAEALFLEAADLIRKHSMAEYYAVALSSFYIPLLIHTGRSAAAAAWMEQHAVAVTDPLDYERELAHITLARVLIAQGRHEEVAPFLARLRTAAEAAARRVHLVQILVLEALNAAARGDHAAALEPLAAALDLAATDGYLRTFLDEGAPLLALLHTARDQRRHPALCERLIALSTASAPSAR